VKTAISIPDETFREVEQRARGLGMSRSEFYTVAARRYLHELNESTTTKQINDALNVLGASDDSSAAAVAAGRRRLASTDDEW
jgi:metal-responsive CopG/Arc/MetJ family transcriptional regulator